MKDKIICLVGENGSGKSTIAELLEKEGYNYIQSYTTRKPRFKDERGHIFVKNAPTMAIDDAEGDFNRTIDKRDMIAYTYYNNEYYWATKEQYQGKGTSIYVIDAAGIKYLKEKVKDAEIIVIYLKADQDTRYDRMVNRECEKLPQIKIYKEYRQACLRIEAKVEKRIENDCKAFKVVSCDYVVDTNRSIEEVLKDVKKMINNG